MTRRAFIVSHTHWDREWYKPYHQFRITMVHVVREILDRLEADPAFEHFVLDGQTVLVDDYLEIHPEDRDRLKQVVKRGALSVGPWYILPDEFLVSGEATVRNLLLGFKTAESLGRVQRVGYLPDSFGHIAQMPQILRGAGIDSFIYTRGNGDEIDELGSEYLWESPDGSEVLAIHQVDGYCNAGGLGYAELWHAHTRREVETEQAVKQVGELLGKLEERSNGTIFLLNNGCDHFPPQKDLGQIVDAVRRSFPDTEFVHGSLGAFVAEIRARGVAKKRFRGELRHGKLHPILSGVWSARIYLKQLNDQAEGLLSDCVEPIAAYTHFLHGRPYEEELIESAWKLLLRNHPHDSICGCSTDPVHREMETRFHGVVQTAEEVLREEAEFLAPTFGRRPEYDPETLITVINPLPECRTEVVDRMIILQPFGFELDHLHLLDESGSDVPFEVLSTDFVERFWGIDYRTQLYGRRQREQFTRYRDAFAERIIRPESERDRADCHLTIRFLARDLPAVGHANYFLREMPLRRLTKTACDQVRIDEKTIEHETLRVTVHENGSLDLFDKRTGESFSGLNLFEDVEDVGDEYDYSPAVETETVGSASIIGERTVLEGGGLSGTIEVAGEFELPVSIDADRRRRSEAWVACPIRIRIGLRRGESLVRVEVDFENRAADHRLRALFPTSIVGDRIFTDSQFQVTPRLIHRPEGTDWVQPPIPTDPQQEFTLAQDGSRGLAVLNRGLPEIEATKDDRGRVTLTLTLLRAVGWLSRDDFTTRRRMNAGPMIPTPEAQCCRAHRFEYAIVPFAGDYLTANVKGLSRRWRVPVCSIQGVNNQRLPGGRSLVSKTTTMTSISAVKRGNKKGNLLVRLYNLTDRTVVETLHIGFDVRRSWRTNLLEERQEELRRTEPHEVAVSLSPHEIVTVEVEPRSDP